MCESVFMNRRELSTTTPSPTDCYRTCYDSDLRVEGVMDYYKLKHGKRVNLSVPTESPPVDLVLTSYHIPPQPMTASTVSCHFLDSLSLELKNLTVGERR